MKYQLLQALHLSQMGLTLQPPLDLDPNDYEELTPKLLQVLVDSGVLTPLPEPAKIQNPKSKSQNPDP